MEDLTECPHCFTKVFPKTGGECPACGRNTRDLAGTNPEVTAMVFKRGAELPQCCVGCGQPTDRYKKIQRTAKADNLPLLLSFVFSLWDPINSFLHKMFEEDHSIVTVRIPVCRTCGRAKGIEPLHVDYENFEMTFLVHKEFKRILEKASTS